MLQHAAKRRGGEERLQAGFLPLEPGPTAVYTVSKPTGVSVQDPQAGCELVHPLKPTPQHWQAAKPELRAAKPEREGTSEHGGGVMSRAGHGEHRPGLHKGITGFGEKGTGRASLLQPQHVAGERGYFQLCRAAPSCLASQSGDTTFGERGRCSLISPTDSFADKKLFSSKPFVLSFVLVGFDIPLPAVTAAPGSSPPALSQPPLRGAAAG